MSLGYFGIRPRRYTFTCVLSWTLLALGPFIAGAGLGGPIVALLMRSEPHSHGMVYGAEPRSSCWRATRAEALRLHPRCEACNCDHDLQAHHCLPYHLFPDRECDVENVIVLCQPCHLRIGHGGDFKAYNPHVREDAARLLEHVKNRKYER